MNREESLAFVEGSFKCLKGDIDALKSGAIATPFIAAGCTALIGLCFDKTGMILKDDMWICIPLAAGMLAIIGLSVMSRKAEKEFLNNLRNELTGNENATIIQNPDYFYTFSFFEDAGYVMCTDRKIKEDLLKSYTKAKKLCHNGQQALTDLNIISYE